MDTAGDGFLASFDGTGRAIRCARAVLDDAVELGLSIRAGVHTGECEVDGDRLRGVALHIGARVASLAGSRQILVTSTVKDLVAGSGITSRIAARHELKGVPDSWQVYEDVGV